MENDIAKSVFLFRGEKWNYDVNEKITSAQMNNRRINIFFSLDYFDFCIAITPKHMEELFGRYDKYCSDISKVISSFSKHSSSRQVFSFCRGYSGSDPFNQDKRYLIITTVSLNAILYEKCTQENIFEEVQNYKEILYKIVEEKFETTDFNVYNIMSNEDFAVVVATDNPVDYYRDVLTEIRNKKFQNSTIFSHSYTIQNYALQYINERYVVKGKKSLDDNMTHIIRARLSNKYWSICNYFPKITNSDFLISADSMNLIGRYNLQFRLTSKEFDSILNLLIEKKIGLCTECNSAVNYKDINCIDDIIYYIEKDLFSYVNERSSFNGYKALDQKDTETGIEVDSYKEQNPPIRDENTKSIENIESSIKDLRLKVSKCIIFQQSENLNAIYRLSKIVESCSSMNRSNHLTATVKYIINIIILLVKEALVNIEYLKGSRQMEGIFTEYFNKGVEAIYVLFSICTNKIYDNLQAPNYDVDYIFATEKILRAYAQVLREFCISYTNETRKSLGVNSTYLPIVIPNPSNPVRSMCVLFADAAIRKNSMEIKGRESENAQDSEHILMIHCPFDEKIFKPSEYLRDLFHELGHYMRPSSRKLRNQFYASYIEISMRAGLYQDLLNTLSLECDMNMEYESEMDKDANDFLRMIAKRISGSLKDIYCDVAEDTYLDIYHDQIYNITLMLMENSDSLHNKFLYLVQKMELILECSESEKFKQLKKAVVDSCGIQYDEMADLSIQVRDCFNKLYTGNYDTDRLGRYKNSCKKLLDYFNQEGKVKVEVLFQELEDISSVRFEQNEYRDKLLQFNLSMDDELDWIKEKYKESDKKYAITRGFFDFYILLNNTLKDLDNTYKQIETAEQFEIDNHLAKIQDHWKKKIYSSIINEGIYECNVTEIKEYHRVIFGLGLDEKKESEASLKQYLKFMELVMFKFKTRLSEIFRACHDMFRESIADYAMYCLGGLDVQSYADIFKGEELENNDFNEKRVAMLYYIISIEKTTIKNDIKDTAIAPKILNTLKQLNEEFGEQDINVLITETCKWMKETGENFRKSFKMNSGELEDCCGVLEFYLKYFYRSKCEEKTYAKN